MPSTTTRQGPIGGRKQANLPKKIKPRVQSINEMSSDELNDFLCRIVNSGPVSDRENITISLKSNSSAKTLVGGGNEGRHKIHSIAETTAPTINSELKDGKAKETCSARREMNSSNGASMETLATPVTQPQPTKASRKERHILLPASLLNVLKKDTEIPDILSTSRLYSEEALGVRNILRDAKIELTQRMHGSTLDPEFFETHLRDGRNVLHYTVLAGDIPLAYEYLYLGLIPDHPDNSGESVLWSAVRLLSEVNSESVKATLRKIHLDPNIDGHATYVLRLKRIIRLFVEQHADVNQIFRHQTLLQVACRSNTPHNWDIISLLIEHGAQRTVAMSSYFPKNRSDQARLSSIFSEKGRYTGKKFERPPRICPCWSGKTLEQCHASDGQPRSQDGNLENELIDAISREIQIPYPPSYICICGSRKSFAKCCAKDSRRRAVPMFETWDDSNQRIMVYTKTPMTHDIDGNRKVTPQFEEMVRRVQSLDFLEDETESHGGGDGRKGQKPESISASRSKLPFAALSKKKLDLLRKEAIRLNLVDPAFAYAMAFVRFPLPTNRGTAARLLRSAYQYNWNNLIDQYIALGVDKRSKFEIERAAKIGQWGGAYIRECEVCHKIEHRDIEKMFQCGYCQVTVYCSRECQTADWKQHKKDDCCKEWQSPRGLPSQDNLSQYMVEKTTGATELSREIDFDKRFREFEFDEEDGTSDAGRSE